MSRQAALAPSRDSSGGLVPAQVSAPGRTYSASVLPARTRSQTYS
jgi:hypothetical protein